MDEPRFYQRPSFFIVSRFILVLILYSVAIYSQWRAGGLSPWDLYLDAIIFGTSCLLWLVFFSQFILPVKSIEERKKILDRLLSYISGVRGPAIFIRDGKRVTRPGEEDRKGPGVLWLDSASAAVTHVNVALKNTFGPGVHFTEDGEKIAETVDLHKQMHRIGPNEKDKPFDAQGDTEYAEYSEVQKRRTMTSALTREGIEVVPNITVVFRINAVPVTGSRPGSRFGYDEQAVRSAVINEAVNPGAKPHTREYRVSWNELPAAIAADLWREHMSKFTVGQLFEKSLQLPSPAKPIVVRPAAPVPSALLSPVDANAQPFLARILTGMLHELNAPLTRWNARWAMPEEFPLEGPSVPVPATVAPETADKTALQLINFMINQRMTQPNGTRLDAEGNLLKDNGVNDEFWFLQNRGIRVLSVSVGNLRFTPEVEEQIISNWTANWLQNARSERERIEQYRSFASVSGQEQALIGYTREICKDLLAKKAQNADMDEVIKCLVARSRMILVRNDRLHRRASSELEELEELLQWLGGNHA